MTRARGRSRRACAPWLPLSCLLLGLLPACSRDTSDAGPRAAAAVAAIALQSDEYREQRGPLPVELTYRLPSHLPAGVPHVLDIDVETPLASGVLEVDIGALAGATLVGEPRRRIDLAAAPRPLRLAVQLVPAAQAPRALTVAIALHGSAGRQQRSWRIELPAE